MSEQHEDAALRARFAELQPARHAAAPQLQELLEAAQVRRQQTQRVVRRRLVIASVASIPLAGALTAYGVAQANARANARLVAELELLAQWRSPTESLLVDPSLAWLSVPPTIGSIVNVPRNRIAGGNP